MENYAVRRPVGKEGLAYRRAELLVALAEKPLGTFLDMDEAGRRWDAMDKSGQGLTTSDIGRMNGWSRSGIGVNGPCGNKAK